MGCLSHLGMASSVYRSSYTMERSGCWNPGCQLLFIISSPKGTRPCVRCLPGEGIWSHCSWLTSAEAEMSKPENVANHPHAAQNKAKNWLPGDMVSGRVWLHKKMCLHKLVIRAWLTYSPASMGTMHTERPLQGKVPTTTCPRIKVSNCACFSLWGLSLYHTAFTA